MCGCRDNEAVKYKAVKRIYGNRLKSALTRRVIGAIITAREIEVACFNSSPFDVADTGEKG